jgi:pimeloyl-ACP methyl ester carboxylesterase
MLLALPFRVSIGLLGIVIGAGVLGASCASPGALSPKLSPLPAALDTTWYVSARGRDNGRDTRRLTDSLEYGFVVYRRRAMDDALTSAIDIRLVDSTRLSRSEFEASLASGNRDTTDREHFTVVYVHGFGTSLHEGWQYAAEARIRSHHPARWVVFCWPSNGLGVSWPRSRALLTRAYHDDTELALASRRAFARTLQSVLATIDASRVVLASHSLGARVVGAALTNEVPLRETLTRTPLRAVAFLTPDIDAQAFGDSIVPVARAVARRVLLYTSGRDRVLAMARQINKTDRAGQRTEIPLIRPGLETVDATDGVVAEGWITARVGTHHAIRRASAALFDLTYVIGGEFAASCRLTIGTANLFGPGVWQLNNRRPPSTITQGTCARFE